MLAISPRTLRRYIADGHVPTRRLPSGHVRIRQTVIDALIDDEEDARSRVRCRDMSAAAQVNVARSTRRRNLHPAPKCRRLPLGTEHADTLMFDTSPEALDEARASAA